MTKQRTMADLLSYAPPPPDTTGTADPGGAIAPSMVQGELRIRDLDLGVRLGFSVPIDIRKLIRRHAAELAKLGVLATQQKPSTEAGGRPGTEYYLNRKQAIFITAKSDTAVAAHITIEIVERFDAYERGAIPAPTVAPPARQDVALSDESRRAIGGMIKHVESKPTMEFLSLLAQQIDKMARRQIAMEAALQRNGILVRPEEARGMFWPMLEVARRKGVTSAGRHPLVCRMSKSMARWCLANNRQMAVRLEQNAEGKSRKVFHIDVVDQWLTDAGNAIVAAHMASLKPVGEANE